MIGFFCTPLKKFEWDCLAYIPMEAKFFLLDQSQDEMYKQWSHSSLANSTQSSINS